jgi:hypothetical protein
LLLGIEGGWDMHCPSCAKGSIIEIHMCVAGSDLTFRRCGKCEAQTWEAPEGFVPSMVDGDQTVCGVAAPRLEEEPEVEEEEEIEGLAEGEEGAPEPEVIGKGGDDEESGDDAAE